MPTQKMYDPFNPRSKPLEVMPMIVAISLGAAAIFAVAAQQAHDSVDCLNRSVSMEMSR
jgi:hypothetical protein